MREKGSVSQAELESSFTILSTNVSRCPQSSGRGTDGVIPTFLAHSGLHGQTENSALEDQTAEVEIALSLYRIPKFDLIDRYLETCYLIKKFFFFF